MTFLQFTQIFAKTKVKWYFNNDIFYESIIQDINISLFCMYRMQTYAMRNKNYIFKGIKHKYIRTYAMTTGLFLLEKSYNTKLTKHLLELHENEIINKTLLIELDKKIQIKFGLQPKMNEGICKLNHVINKISFRMLSLDAKNKRNLQKFEEIICKNLKKFRANITTYSFNMIKDSSKRNKVCDGFYKIEETINVKLNILKKCFLNFLFSYSIEQPQMQMINEIKNSAIDNLKNEEILELPDKIPTKTTKEIENFNNLIMDNSDGFNTILENKEEIKNLIDNRRNNENILARIALVLWL